MRIAIATYISARGFPGVLAGLVAALLVVGGCGGGEAGEGTRGGALTVYASAPRNGVSAREARAVIAAQRLALEDARGRAAGRRVRLVELDSSKPDGETWDPSLVERNAERAADDPTAVAYLGELDYGGSAVSVPVTNAAGLLQVSPGDGLTSLTQEPPAGSRTGPERYYPEGRRTFLRLVPNDGVAAQTLVEWMRELGAESLVVVHDGRLAGRELAGQAAAAATRAEMRVAEVGELRRDPGTETELARQLADEAPDSVLYTGVGDQRSESLLRALRRALPAARLYGSSGLATGRAGAAPPVNVVKAARPAASYGGGGRRLLARVARATGEPAPAEALYGYEAMRLVLAAIAAAGPDRAAVVRAALAPGRRRSLLGAYELTGTGDVSPAHLAAYSRARDGLRFQGLRGPDGPVRP